MKGSSKIGDIVLSFAVGAQQLLLSIQIFLGDITFNPERMASLRVMASAVVVLISLFWIIKRRLGAAVVLYSVVMLFFLWSLFLTPQLYSIILDQGIRFTCLTCAPITLAFLSIRDFNIFHKTFLITCIITSLVGILYSLLLIGGQIVQVEYNMAFGYSLMMSALYFFYSRKPLLMVLGVVTTICIFLDGSRGPVVVIALYILFLFYRNLDLKKIILLLFVFAFIYILYLNLDVVLSFLSEHGIHSRTLQKLIDNEFLESSSREDIYGLGIESIKQSPLLGYGVFADRLIYDPYIHNFILEVFIDYGVPLGVIFLLCIAVRFIARFRKYKDAERDFLVLVLLGSIIPLMASSSYLIDFRFFFLIGVLAFPLNRRLSNNYI